MAWTKINNNNIGTPYTQEKIWKGKVVNVHGDSNVASTTPELGKSYIDTVKEEHEFFIYNMYAFSGANMGQIYGAFITQDTSADLSLITGGGNVINLGTMADRDSSTFYGSLHAMVIWHFANMPDATLAIIGTTNRDTIDNNRSLRAKAMEEVAKYYSLPFLNFWERSGIMPLTAAKFTKDGIHPNALGYERLASLTNDFLYKILPI